MFDPDYCEKRCPVCTRARKGNRFARFLQAIEMVDHLWRLSLGPGKGEEVWGEAERAVAAGKEVTRYFFSTQYILNGRTGNRLLIDEPDLAEMIFEFPSAEKGVSGVVPVEDGVPNPDGRGTGFFEEHFPAPVLNTRWHSWTT